MSLYDTEIEAADAFGRNDARSVDAWIRAAAYAAGEDPEAFFSLARSDARLAEESAQAVLDFLR
jgi:hypothetical protein